MKIGTLFTGIEGFGLGFEREGFRIAWQVEIDKPCTRVLERHWPEVTRYGDIQTVKAGDLGPVDVICGGFPCQDLSVAGKRAGLDGARSGLFFEFMRIVAVLRPAWLVIENVPGLLSSNRGRDMGAVLGALAQLGYGYAYRVLDAQYFGVAQRRKRVFIVGHLGEPWSAPAKVLFEPESCSGDPPPSREAGKEVAGTLTGGFGERGVDADQIANGNYAITAHSLTTRPGERLEPSSETYVIQDAAMPRDKKQNGIGITAGGPCYTLDGNGAHAVATLRASGDNHSCFRDADGIVAMHETGQGWWNESELAGTLRAEGENRPSRPSNILFTPVAAFSAGRGMAVRRLTPLECERLQGFPDNWAKGESDSARYSMLGNSVAVPVIAWIARRMKEVIQCSHQ